MPSRDIETIFTSPGGSVEKSIPYTVVLGHAASGSIARIIGQFPDWVIPISFDHLLLPQAFHLGYHLPNVPFIHNPLDCDFILLFLNVIKHLV